MLSVAVSVAIVDLPLSGRIGERRNYWPSRFTYVLMSVCHGAAATVAGEHDVMRPRFER